MKRDPYIVLGVERGSSPEVIRRAYKIMARRHHPDLNPQRKNAAETFREIVDAYQQLIDDPAEPDIKAPRRRYEAPRWTPKKPRDAASTSKPFAGGDAAYIVSADLQGWSFIHHGAFAAVIATSGYVHVALGDASTFVFSVVSIILYIVGLLAYRFLKARVTFSHSYEHAELFGDLAASVIGACTIAGGLWCLDFLALPYPTAVAMLGGMIFAYMVGRMWKRHDAMSTFVVGVVLGAPMSAILASLMTMFFAYSRYGIMGRSRIFKPTGSFGDDPILSVLIGTLVGGLVGSLVAIATHRSDSLSDDLIS